MVMPQSGENDRALDALIVLAFLEIPMPDLSGPEPELDPADRRALDALGSDLVQRVLEADDR